MANIQINIKNKIASVGINNPEKMNCLDMEMLENLENLCIDIKKNKTARVVILKGVGGKAFSTGGNLKDFTKLNGFDEIRKWISYGNEVFNLLENLPVATIAAIDGYAMGGGLELALSCDLRIATENSIFSMPELNHGWVPGWGGLAKLRRLIGESKAKEMIMLGERIDGKEAHRIGLINKVCHQDEHVALITDIATKLVGIDPFVMEMSKASIMDHGRTTFGNDLIFDALATNYSRKGL